MKSYNNQHKNDDDNVKTSNKTGEIALRYSLNYYYYYHFFSEHCSIATIRTENSERKNQT